MVAEIDPPKMMIDGVFGEKHLEIAAQKHQDRNDNRASDQAHARHDIHGRLHAYANRPAILDGTRLILNRVVRPYGRAIKDA